jgi:hypothetical protein
VCGLSNNLPKRGGKAEQSVMQLYIARKVECRQSSFHSGWLQSLHRTEDNSAVLKLLLIHLLAIAHLSIPDDGVPNLEQGMAKRKRSDAY